MPVQKGTKRKGENLISEVQRICVAINRLSAKATALLHSIEAKEYSGMLRADGRVGVIEGVPQIERWLDALTRDLDAKDLPETHRPTPKPGKK